MTSKLITEYQVIRLINGKGFDDTVINGGTRGVYASSGATDNFHNDLRLSSQKRVIINILGDSITEGNFASDMRNASPTGTSYVANITRELQQLFGDGGSGFQHCYDPTNNGVTYSGLPTEPVVWGGTGNTITTFAGTPPYGSYTAVANLNASVTTFTRGSQVAIFIITNAGGARASVTIDDILVDVFDTYSVAATFSVRLYSVTANVVHTVKVTNIGPSASGTSTSVAVFGMGGYNPTGVVINKFSRPGGSLENLVANANDAGTGIGNLWENMIGANNITHPLYPYFNCSLFIYALGVNGGTTSGANNYTFAQLWKAFNRMKQLKPTLDLFCIQTVAGSGSIDSTTGYQDIGYAQIRDQTQDVCRLLGAAFLDLNLYIKSAPSYLTLGSEGFFSIGTTNTSPQCPNGQAGLAGTPEVNLNGIHPSDAGMKTMSDVILPFLFTDF